MSTMLAVCATRVRRAVAPGSRPNWSSHIAQAIASILVFGALICAEPAAAQFVQQGQKLVGSGYAGQAYQGFSVALSTDGTTAIVGGYGDNNGVGAAWVFTQTGGTWTQQGTKLVGSGYSGSPQQGHSVALSADGTTAIVGGYSGIGAAWVFTQSGGTWAQQTKLVGSGSSGPSEQGASVALSADGTTAIVGGDGDNNNVGAAWVFTQSGGTWTQQTKLVGTGYSGTPYQGRSVALSADGTTAIVGGPGDNNNVGAAWVFTQSGGTWTQQTKLVGPGKGQGQSVALSGDGTTAIVGGPGDTNGVGATWVFTQSGGTWTQQAKLVGTGYSGTPQQGTSVALSGDGTTAIVGGYGDGINDIGAAWVFTQSGGTWTQQGSKRVGNGAVYQPTYQGTSVALSADGNTAIVGGFFDNIEVGAAWVFARHNPAAAHDFSGDGTSDLLWRKTSGALAMWLMSGGQLSSSHSFGIIPGAYSVIGQRDFSGDRNADLLWRDTGGNLYMWLMNGATVASTASLGNVPTTWTVYGTGDFNGDGLGDILWQDSSGDVAIWFMNGATVLSTTDLGTVPTSTWSIVGSDMYGDILWIDTSSNYSIWQVAGGQVTATAGFGNVPANWQFMGFGDFNGDGVMDILWRDTNTGTVAIWFLNSSGNIQSTASVGAVPIATTWTIAQTGDYDDNGMSDILWIDGTGNVAIWFMNGATIASTSSLGNVGTTWTVQAQNAE